MWTKLAIIAMLIVLFICTVYFSSSKRKEKLFLKYNKSFGKEPQNYNKEANIEFLKDFYKARKENENENEEEVIDEITWNDLDMNNVFQRINYTNTTLGEAYLYKSIKEIKYSKEKWDELEGLIKVFSENEDLRNEIRYNLSTIGKLNDPKVFNFIYRPQFNKVQGYFKYPILAGGFIASLLLCIINSKIGIGLSIFFFCANILFYQSGKTVLEDSFKIMNYLINNVIVCQKLCKINHKEFRKYKKKFRKILANCRELNKIKRYSYSLVRKNSSALLDADLVLEYLKMFFMVDIIAYHNMASILEKNKKEFQEIYDLIAMIDFALSVAYYRASLQEFCQPIFLEKDYIELENLYHPLIDEPVKNSIFIKDNIIFTGSNASGKSTFIKAIALNCILAQGLNTALCSSYKCKFSKVVTSMAIKDDILEGDSYFIAEIKSLKRLLNSLNGEIRVLAFIDEILKGTNTVERIAASASILDYGKESKAKILVATHDMELTEMLGEKYDNYHFRETVIDKEVLFDYKLHKGPSKTRNAIKLLKAMDFDKEVVNTANEIYSDFIINKKWDRL